MACLSQFGGQLERGLGTLAVFSTIVEVTLFTKVRYESALLIVVFMLENV